MNAALFLSLCNLQVCSVNMLEKPCEEIMESKLTYLFSVHFKEFTECTGALQAFRVCFNVSLFSP